MKRKKVKNFKKKKGFTLVEMIIALVILVGIGLVIGANLNRLSNRQNEENYEIFKNNITTAADIYLNQHTTRLNDLFVDRGYLIVLVDELKTAGLIDNNLINPQTGDIVGNSEQIKVSLDASGLIQYVYPVDQNILNEEYLQVLNVYLEVGETVNCRTVKSGNNFELALVDVNGILNTNLDSFTFSCDWGNPSNNLDTNDSRRNTVGTHIITYTYTTSTGVQKTTTRNFIVMPKLTVNLIGIPNPSGYAPTGTTPNDPIKHMDLASGSEKYAWHNQTSISINGEANRHANVNYSWTRYNTTTCTGAVACSSTVLSTSNILPAEFIIEGVNLYRLDYEVRMYNTPGSTSYKGFELFLIRVDRTSPTCVTTRSPAMGPHGQAWTNTDVTITGNCTDLSNANGTDASKCRPNPVRTFTSNINSNERTTNVIDWANNSKQCPTILVQVDKTLPSCSTTRSPNMGPYNSVWTNTNVTITGNCSVGWQAPCMANPTRTFTNNTNGNYRTSNVENVAGSTAICPEILVQIDKTPPTCSTSGGSSSWTTTSRTIIGTCSDTGGSGCWGNNPQYTYRVNTNITNGGPGSGGATASVTDKAGNTATCSANQTVKVDVGGTSCNSSGCSAFSGIQTTQYCKMITNNSSSCSWGSDSSRSQPTTCNTTNYFFIRGTSNAGVTASPASRGSYSRTCSCPSGNSWCSYSLTNGNTSNPTCNCPVQTRSTTIWNCTDGSRSITQQGSMECGSSSCSGKCNCNCPGSNISSAQNVSCSGSREAGSCTQPTPAIPCTNQWVSCSPLPGGGCASGTGCNCGPCTGGRARIPGEYSTGNSRTETCSGTCVIPAIVINTPNLL